MSAKHCVPVVCSLYDDHNSGRQTFPRRRAVTKRHEPMLKTDEKNLNLVSSSESLNAYVGQSVCECRQRQKYTVRFEQLMRFLQNETFQFHETFVAS